MSQRSPGLKTRDEPAGLEADDAIRFGDCGLRGGMEAFAIEVIALRHGAERLIDSQIGVKKLHFGSNQLRVRGRR